MFRRAAHAGRGTGGSSAYKRLRGDADDDSDVLLPVYGEIPRFRSMVPTPELKYLDLYKTYTSLSNAPGLTGGMFNPDSLQIASVPDRGSGPQNFSGRGVLIKNWSVKGTIGLAPVVAADSLPYGRLAFIALVLDTKTNGSQCNSEDIFTDVIGSDVAMCTPMINMANSGRFIVLARKTIELNVKTHTNEYEPGIPSTYQTCGVIKPFEFFVPLNLTVAYKAFDSGSPITNVIDNSLHVVAFTSYYNPLLVNAPFVAGGYIFRIRFLSEDD